MEKIKRFLKDERGNEAPEYALIAALIAVVMIVGVTAAGQAIVAKFNEVATAITNAPGGS
jgi:pilus assembly protein Flp/PilA